MAAIEAGRGALREARTARPTAGQPDGSDSAESTHIGDSSRTGDDHQTADERATVSNADSLVLMAQTLLSSGAEARPAADRSQVLVHVDAATLVRDEDGSCQLDDGTALHPETVRRLACDASLVRILERDGRPLSLGRKTRSISTALRRALGSRDPICRFPGCSQRRFLDAHHVDHWVRGGRTELANLAHLCSHHHRLLHEGGYRIARGAHGALRFHRPDGRPVPSAPPRPSGNGNEPERRNHEYGLDMTDQTCVPHIYAGDRFDLCRVVDGLAESDPRLA